MFRRADRLFLALGAALAGATALRLPAAWASGNALNHVSGAWMTLADDLAHGTFYRPLSSALGYGGTRFFPLVFSLEAALVRAGVPLLPAGYALSLASGVLLVAAVRLLLRRLGVAPVPALAFAALALAGFAGQHGLAAARGDLLPVALSAFGLAALAPGPSRPRLVAAIALFALAFAAKPTALTAPVAAAVFLALRGERRAAIAVVGGVGAAAAIVIAATDVVSGGRFLALLRACATGDAATSDALRAPVRLAEELARADRSGLVLVGAAVFALAFHPFFRAPRLARRSDVAPIALPALWLAAAAAGAVSVFASPGTGVNHLVELEAAAAIALGVAAASPGAAGRAARLAAPVAAASGLALALSSWSADRISSRLAEIHAVVRSLPAGPVFSEDPLVPLAAGERPAVLDAWMLRVASSRDGTIARRAADELGRARYPALVLFDDIDGPPVDGLTRRNLGDALAREIRARYVTSAAIGRYHLYRPRERAAGQASPKVNVADPPASVVPPPAPR